MQKKHQIFISSTFTDLKDERQAAVESILAAGHIPAGMELFAAGDESQMEVIKRWINDSDIYMLILGGRYGSIEPSSDLSYTEIEYDYALSISKPFFALVLSESFIKAKVNSDSNLGEVSNLESYNKFRDKVLSKISRKVEDTKDIKIGVLESVRLIESKYELHGWVRSNELPEVAPIITQLSNLTQENASLKKKLESTINTTLDNGAIELASLKDNINVEIIYKSNFKSDYLRELVETYSWESLFGLFAPILLSAQNDGYMQSYIARQILDSKGVDCYNPQVKEQNFQTIKIHLIALNLITVDYSKTISGGAALFWKLTQNGQNTLLTIRAIKKN